MNITPEKKKIIIAGPCALESRQQLAHTVDQLLALGVENIRASLWKPRTSPGWDGFGFYGLPMLLEETIPRGITPATEIISAIHAQMMVDALKQFGSDGKAIVWIGARNQNHFELRRMAQILANGPPSIQLMFKNQVWLDKKHWLGIFQHIMAAGFPIERLWGCHRGFHPGYANNAREMRNMPEFEMAMEMQEVMNIPMLIDPSHMGGSRDKVFELVRESLDYDFGGYMIEVHDQPTNAKTDMNQQLTFHELEKILQIINQPQALIT